MKVKDIVKPAVVISETDTFSDALEAMTTQHTNTVLVVNEEGELSGEVSVVDLLDAIIPTSLDGSEVTKYFNNDESFITSVGLVRDLPVEEFMARDFSALTLNDDLLPIVSTAIAHQRARIPVVDQDNRPIGIISRQGLKQILAKFLEAS